MTRAELHSITGFHAPTLLAAVLHLRTTMKRKRESDATSIINNEGRMNGYLDAIDDLIAAASSQPPAAPKKEYQPYAPPAQPQTETQNKP